MKRESNTKERPEMVEASIRIRSGSASVNVRIVAASVERAMGIAGIRFPGKNIKLICSKEIACRSKSGIESISEAA